MEIKITRRKSGWTCLVTYPWGAKVRIAGLATKEDAQNAATAETESKRKYTLDKDLGLSSAAAAMGRHGGGSANRKKKKTHAPDGSK